MKVLFVLCLLLISCVSQSETSFRDGACPKMESPPSAGECGELGESICRLCGCDWSYGRCVSVRDDSCSVVVNGTLIEGEECRKMMPPISIGLN